MCPAQHLEPAQLVLGDKVVLAADLLNAAVEGIALTKAAGATMVPHHRVPDLPLVEGSSVQPGRPYPSAVSDRPAFELPTWQLGMRVEGARTVPALKLQWFDGVIEQGQPIAQLRVGLDATYSSEVAAGRRRPMAHVMNVALRSFTPAEDDPTLGTWTALDFAETVQDDLHVTATLPIATAADVQRVWLALTQEDRRSQLGSRMSIPVVEEQRCWQLITRWLEPVDLFVLPTFVSNKLPVATAHIADKVEVDTSVFTSDLSTIVTAGVSKAPMMGLAIAAPGAMPPAPPSVAHGPAMRAGPIVAAPSSARAPITGTFDQGGTAILDHDVRQVVDHAQPPAVAGSGAAEAPPDAATKASLLRTAVRIDDQLTLGNVIVTDPMCEPVLAVGTCEERQQLPMFFVPELFPELFSVPDTTKGAPSTSLRRHAVTVPGPQPGQSRTVALLQDPLEERVFFYTPESFLLARGATAPYRPALTIAFLDELTADGDQPVIQTTAQVSIRVEPSLEPAVMRSLRRALPALAPAGTKPELLPLDLADATVELDSFGGPWNGQPVYSSVSFGQGGTVTVRLDPSQFAVLFAALQDPVPAMVGRVRTTAADDVIEVPLLGSLFDAAGTEVAIVRRQTGYAIQNRSIGTVVIESAELVDEVTAAAIDLRLPVPFELVSGKEVPVDGALLTDANVTGHYLDAVAALREIPALRDPTFLHGFMLSPGHLSTGHDVTFSLRNPAALAALAPDPALGPVTAVRVEVSIDPAAKLPNDTVIELDAATPTVTARIRSDVIAGLLPELQATADQFFYRVVNQHGDEGGAASQWRKTIGDSVSVDPVPVT